MRWSFRLARVAGIDVRIHVTFLLLLAWFALGYYASGGAGAVLGGLSFTLLVFSCVLLHEFGHALAARLFGIRTPDITLLPIGGLARLERMPEKPWQELLVALAGPAVNVAIAFVLYLVVGHIFRSHDLATLGSGKGDVLRQLMAINVILVVFNLIPAFPMDGGRVLRSILAMGLKHGQATRIAATVGQVAAVGLGLLGLMLDPVLLFIAVFVFFSARQEALLATVKEAARETPVARIMRPLPAVFVSGMSVLEAARIALHEPRPYYAVVAADLRPVSFVHAGDLADAVNYRPADDIVSLGRPGLAVLGAGESVLDAVSLAERSAQSGFLVINASGQVVGSLDREDLARFFREGH